MIAISGGNGALGLVAGPACRVFSSLGFGLEGSRFTGVRGGEIRESLLTGFGFAVGALGS